MSKKQASSPCAIFSYLGLSTLFGELLTFTSKSLKIKLLLLTLNACLRCPNFFLLKYPLFGFYNPNHVSDSITEPFLYI